MREAAASESLLDWYDANARKMPWRIPPAEKQAGVAPNPYHVWLSEIMLQQTTVAAVRDYFVKFITIWPSVADLAAAEDADVMAAWAGLGYYARARNLLKCARAVVANHNGIFPQTEDALQKLPGIGPYTSAAIASIAFDQQATVVDGNVERVMSRLFAVEVPLPTSKPELTRYATQLTPTARQGDYNQAVMDLGATICTPRSPACGICPWRDPCRARIEGIAAELPKKLPKKVKPTRHGIAYVARRSDGAWLLETRPEKGLLGGMLGWPGSDWGDAPQPNPPLKANWQEAGMEVRHTFTHFHLRLQIMVSWAETEPILGRFVPHDQFSPASLPTVMRKVYDAASPLLALN
ncbi:MAG: A/G-specific adenine glycosylase [Pseudomonadota bacterium]